MNEVGFEGQSWDFGKKPALQSSFSWRGGGVSDGLQVTVKRLNEISESSNVTVKKSQGEQLPKELHGTSERVDANTQNLNRLHASRCQLYL